MKNGLVFIPTRKRKRGMVHNTSPKAQVLKLRYFGFRGNAQFVYLAKPVGPGPRSP
jgi:hypothetical protein